METLKFSASTTKLYFIIVCTVFTVHSITGLQQMYLFQIAVNGLPY